MRWIVLFGLLVFGVVGMTALDKFDEGSCRDDPQVIERIRSHVPDGDGITNVTERVMYEACDGFLPW